MLHYPVNTRPIRIFHAVMWSFLICLAGLPVSAARSAGTNPEDIETTRTALKEWIQTQQIISQEKRDFALAQEMLNQRIELVQREIESLRQKIKDAETSIAEADKKRIDLIKENETLKEASASLEDTLPTLEGRLKQLLIRLPDPIRQRVKPLSQRLPEDGKETKQSLSERFQNVVGILNETDKFNRDITVTSEVRSMPDSRSIEVTAVYVGIGQSYYTSADGTAAGLGTTAEDGWIWKPCNEFAPQIARLIAILKNEQVASFVQVPVEIQ